MSLADLFYAKHPRRSVVLRRRPRKVLFEPLESRLLLSAHPYLVQGVPGLAASLENPSAPALTVAAPAQAPTAAPTSAPSTLVAQLASPTLVDPSPATDPALPPGATITVNSAADTAAPGNVLTLREAILLSNGTLSISQLTPEQRAQVKGTHSDTTRDTIAFNIPGDGVRTIFVGGKVLPFSRLLPFITHQVIIDGTTQPGFDRTTHVPVIRSGDPRQTRAAVPPRPHQAREPRRPRPPARAREDP